MLADGNGAFTAAIGMELDASGFGMGSRSKRFAMIVDDGTVTHLAIEPPGGIVVSAAEAIMEQL
jgi:peroxiredoxin